VVEVPRGILSGIRVLDFSRMLSGPYCTMMLADHGAEVIKIESPEGDTSRSNGPWRADDVAHEWAGYFVSLNRSKKSIVLDLKTEEAKVEIRNLVREYVPVLGYTPAVRTSGPIDTAVPPTVADQLLPVLREAISNVARHALAERAEVDVQVTAHELVLTVSDDGSEVRYGIRTARRFSAATARAARKATVALSTPPDRPTTSRSKPVCSSWLRMKPMITATTPAIAPPRAFWPSEPSIRRLR